MGEEFKPPPPTQIGFKKGKSILEGSKWIKWTQTLKHCTKQRIGTDDNMEKYKPLPVGNSDRLPPDNIPVLSVRLTFNR